jgi:hypothetical protein
MNKVPAWSYSSIGLFSQCPHKYFKLRVEKSIKEPPAEHLIYGNDVHKTCEEFIDKGKPVPEKYAFTRPYLNTLNAKPGSKFAEYKVGLKKVDGRLVACDFFDPDVWFRGVIDLLILDIGFAEIYDYKGLALDTKLPTPTGFTTMGDVQVGDVLFSESGGHCNVVGKSEVKNLRCYKITFDDTSTVVCDEEHLWKLTDGRVVGVEGLKAVQLKRQRINVPAVCVAEPLALPDIELPIDPYVLGMWIADGTCRDGRVSKPDTFIWEEIQRRGYKVNMNTGNQVARCPTRTVLGLNKSLQQIGLIYNKHIPDIYLRAGYQQRLDLLRGLMDGDGSPNPTRNQAVYSTVDEKLADQVCELLCTLGQRPLKNTVNAHGFGKDVVAYPVSFRPVGVNPFLLPRKADRVDLAKWGRGHSWYRSVLKVEEVESVPTQCIRVDSHNHTFLCTDRMIPTHNTGSNKYPDTDQLALMAACVFIRFPKINRIRAGLLFFKAPDLVKKVYTREHGLDIFVKLDPVLQQRETAYETGVFNKKRNFTCNGWCPVQSCPNWKPKR